MQDKNPRRHGFAVGEKVMILTKAGGCYDRKTGVVAAKLDRGLLPDPDADIPCFYEILTDEPVDIGGGTLSSRDVHPSREVFPADTTVKNYWDAAGRYDR